MPAQFANQALRIALMNQHRLPAAFALMLSVQFAFVVWSPATSPSSSYAADTWSYNGAVYLTANTYDVSETSASVTITAMRGGGTHGAISVTYKTVNETAIAGQQYTAATGTLKWADGDHASKTLTIPLLHTKTFTGTKYFALHLTAITGALFGSPDNANVNILGGGSTLTKSIRQFGVSCSDLIDNSDQLTQAINSAANHAFTLVIDCPVRFHTGTDALTSIAVPDGVTISFEGGGEFLVVSSGPPALTVAHRSQVSFFHWNLTYL
jgi:hypothetical protein